MHKTPCSALCWLLDMMASSRLPHQCFVLHSSYRFRFHFLVSQRKHNDPAGIRTICRSRQWHLPNSCVCMTHLRLAANNAARLSECKPFAGCSMYVPLASSILTMALLSSMCCLCFGFVTTKFRCEFSVREHHIQLGKIQTYTHTFYSISLLCWNLLCIGASTKCIPMEKMSFFNKIGGKLYFMCEYARRAECPMSVRHSPSSILSICWRSFNFLFKEIKSVKLEICGQWGYADLPRSDNNEISFSFFLSMNILPSSIVPRISF